MHSCASRHVVKGEDTHPIYTLGTAVSMRGHDTARLAGNNRHSRLHALEALQQRRRFLTPPPFTESCRGRVTCPLISVSYLRALLPHRQRKYAGRAGGRWRASWHFVAECH